MTADAPSPSLQVALLEKRIAGRGTGMGVTYLMPDELDALIQMARTGAAYAERRITMLSILTRVHVTPGA